MADININFGQENLEQIKKMLDDLLKLMERLEQKTIKTGVLFGDEALQAKAYTNAVMKLDVEKRRLEKAQEKYNEALKVEEGSLKDLTKQYKELKNSIESKNKSNVTKQEIAQLQALGKEIKKVKEDTNTWGRAIDSFQFKFNALGNIAANALSGMTSKLSNILKQFISFDKIIQSTQGSADTFARELEALKASFNQLNIAIATGNFENFFEGLIRASKAAREYADAIDDISDRKRQLSVNEAETLKRQAELTEIWKNPDATYSVKQQIDAVKELMTIQEELSKKTSSLAEKAYKAELTKVQGVTGLTEEEIMTYISLYDQQEELVKIGKQLGAAKQVIATSSKFEADAAREVLKTLKQEAELLGADEKAITIYSKMVNKFSDADRQAVVDKYKAFKEAEVGYIMENKRLMGSLYTLNRQFLVEQENERKKKKAGIIKDTKELYETIDPLQRFADEVSKIWSDLTTINQFEQEEITKNFVKNWQDRTNEEDKELKKQTQMLQEQKLTELMIYADFFGALSSLANENSAFFKAASVAEATINAMVAAIDAMRQTKTGAIGKLAAFAVILSAGLTAVARIKSVSIPKKAEGGEIGGKSHSQGGTLIEAERGEFVIRKSAYQKNKELVKAINSDDSLRIAMALNQDKKIEVKRDYTKDLLEYIKKQPVYGETKDFYIVHEGNRITKIHKN